MITTNFGSESVKLMNKYFRFLKNFDWVMFGSAILLLGFGLAIIYSTTFNASGGSEAAQQALFAVIGLVALFWVARVDYRIFQNYSGILYILTIILLLSVEFFGVERFGAVRWIDLGFMQFQPSEIAKVFMIIVMAKFFSENFDEMHRFRTILKSLFYIGIPTGLVAAQPDLGTALTFMVIWGSMILISGMRKIYYLYFAGAAAVIIPVAYKFFLHDYQRDRITTFLNPANDPMGTGWNVNQAMIAIGSGKFWGRGLGHGPQSQLNFVPFKHTDFVFAALAEEMGMLGALFVILLFGLLLYRAIKASREARDFFGMFIAIGIFAKIFFHVFINIGMNIGIMPVTGIPLPLVSAGGTSIVITLASIGLLESIASRNRKIDF